jgi:hypothetical protein
MYLSGSAVTAEPPADIYKFCIYLLDGVIAY